MIGIRMQFWNSLTEADGAILTGVMSVVIDPSGCEGGGRASATVVVVEECVSGDVSSKFADGVSLGGDDFAFARDQLTFSLDDLSSESDDSTLDGLGGLQQGVEDGLLESPDVEGLVVVGLKHSPSYLEPFSVDIFRRGHSP